MMMMMATKAKDAGRRVAVGSDRRGEEVARHVLMLLQSDGLEVLLRDGASEIVGRADYADEAWRVATAVARGDADLGILISGSAIGMSITANKVPGARAVIAHDEWIVRRARAHHYCNVLCIPADLIGLPYCRTILDTWIGTEFEGGRHERRVSKIGMVERGEDPSECSDCESP